MIIGIDGDWKLIPALMVTLRFADGTEKTVPAYEIEILHDGDE